jgi:polyferredoxin
MYLNLSDIRRATQIIWLFLCNVYFSVFFQHQIYRGPLKCSCLPVLQCFACPTAIFSCPIGTMQYFIALHQFPFFLVGHLGLICLFVGRMACGWLCPVGLVQDLLHNIKCPKIDIPEYYAHLRYAVFLLLVVLLPLSTSENWFSKLCPWGTLTAGLPWVLWNPYSPAKGGPLIAPGSVGILFGFKVSLLLAFIYFSMVHKRPFCRYICPLGLLFSFFNKCSLLKLEVQGTCNECDSCAKVCPVDIKVYQDPNSEKCIRCLNCLCCNKVKVTTLILQPQKVGSTDPGGKMPQTKEE